MSHQSAITNPHMLVKIRSEALRQACGLMPCELRISSFIPGHKCASDDTVVGCHCGSLGKGFGTKVSDLGMSAGCMHCHDLIDGRDERWEWLADTYPAAVSDRILNGVLATQARWIMMGLLVVPDAELI